MNLFLPFSYVKGHLLSNVKYHIFLNCLHPSSFRPPPSFHCAINYDSITFSKYRICWSVLHMFKSSQLILPHIILNGVTSDLLWMHSFLILSLSVYHSSISTFSFFLHSFFGHVAFLSSNISNYIT